MSTSIWVLGPVTPVDAIPLIATRQHFHRPWIMPVTNGRNTEQWVRIFVKTFVVLFFRPHKFSSRSSPRRDPFVKNKRIIWVTASQSPLGLASGSLTPPPAMGSASNLQLGLMGSANNANRGLMNPAPGAEAMSKFRASGTYLSLRAQSLSRYITHTRCALNLRRSFDRCLLSFVFFFWVSACRLCDGQSGRQRGHVQHDGEREQHQFLVQQNGRCPGQRFFARRILDHVGFQTVRP